MYRRAPGTAFFLPVSPIVPKGAVYRETVHKAVSQIIDTGMAKYAQDTEIKSSWTQGKQWARSGNGRKEAADSPVDERLRLEHLLGVFLILLANIVIALVILGLERVTAVVPVVNFVKDYVKNIDV